MLSKEGGMCLSVVASCLCLTPNIFLFVVKLMKFGLPLAALALLISQEATATSIFMEPACLVQTPVFGTNQEALLASDVPFLR